MARGLFMFLLGILAAVVVLAHLSGDPGRLEDAGSHDPVGTTSGRTELEQRPFTSRSDSAGRLETQQPSAALAEVAAGHTTSEAASTGQPPPVQAAGPKAAPGFAPGRQRPVFEDLSTRRYIQESHRLLHQTTQNYDRMLPPKERRRP